MGFGQLRHAMEDAGVWDTSTIIVTSDHGGNTNGKFNKIPFLVKLPNQSLGGDINTPYNAVETRSLVRNLYLNKIKDGREFNEAIKKFNSLSQKRAVRMGSKS